MTERAGQFYFEDVNGEFVFGGKKIEVDSKGKMYYPSIKDLPDTYFNLEGTRKPLDQLTLEQKGLIFAGPEATKWHSQLRLYFQEAEGEQQPIRPRIIPPYSWEAEYGVEPSVSEAGKNTGRLKLLKRALFDLMAVSIGLTTGVGAEKLMTTPLDPEKAAILTVGNLALIFMGAWTIDLFSRMQQIENYYERLARS